MTTQYESGWTARSIDRTMAIEGRPFETEEPTPCRTEDSELWFSPFRDRVRAARACKSCPFIGRCGYNAVLGREQYGVWAGIALPGSNSTPEKLESAYILLLAQFERRRQVELGDLQVPLPSTNVRRRRANGSVFEDDEFDDIDIGTDARDAVVGDDYDEPVALDDMDFDDIDFDDSDFDGYAAIA